MFCQSVQQETIQSPRSLLIVHTGPLPGVMVGTMNWELDLRMELMMVWKRADTWQQRISLMESTDRISIEMKWTIWPGFNRERSQVISVTTTGDDWIGPLMCRGLCEVSVGERECENGK